MQDKALKFVFRNRLWINGLWAIAMALVVLILIGDSENKLARTALEVMLSIGVMMVVVSPFHAKTTSSKIASFLVSAFVAAIGLHKWFL